MKKEDIKNEIIDLIRSKSDFPYNDEFNDDDHIQNDLGFDSLDCIELIMNTEIHFKISIPDEEYEPMRDWTFGQYIDFIETKVNAR